MTEEFLAFSAAAGNDLSTPAPDFGFSRAELHKLRALKTPAGVQRFLDALPYNLSYTARSPKQVLHERTASCLEGGRTTVGQVENGGHRASVPVRRVSEGRSALGSDLSQTIAGHTPAPAKWLARAALWIAAAIIVSWLILNAIDIAQEIRTDMSGSQMLHVVWLGMLTLLRVVAMSVIATLVWTPTAGSTTTVKSSAGWN